MTVDQAQRRKLLARWHRRLALLVVAWLVLLAASGLLINHAHDWGLDRKPAPALVQSGVYGIDPTQGFCQFEKVIGAECRTVFARLELAAADVLVAPAGLYLLGPSGQLLERLTAGHLGLERVLAAASDGARLFLKDGVRIIEGDEQLLGFRLLASNEPGRAGAVQIDELEWHQSTVQATFISWERVLLDLHAARFLGPLGKVFSDLMAVLILALAVTGYWMHRSKRKNGKDRVN